MYTDSRWYDRRKPGGECDTSEETRSLKDDWGEGVCVSDLLCRALLFVCMSVCVCIGSHVLVLQSLLASDHGTEYISKKKEYILSSLHFLKMKSEDEGLGVRYVVVKG